MKTENLPVPGAALHYEIRGSEIRDSEIRGSDVRGTAPLVLLICGGIYDAAAFTELAEHLAATHTVVTYDRRGNSRSPLDGPPTRQSITEHADDAHRLITELGGPALVFGNSSGAQIGLDLAARHPGDVRALAAHEPPLFDLLPDAAHWRQVVADVGRAHAEGGAEQAMGLFATAMGMVDPDTDPDTAAQDDAVPAREAEPSADSGPEAAGDPEVAAMMARFAANTDFFLAHEVPGFGAHPTALPDSVPVIPLVGADSAGEPPHRATLALAARLGVEAVTVPGGHGGFGTHAADVATTLTTLFQEHTR